MPFFGQLPFWQRRLPFWLWKEPIGTILLVQRQLPFWTCLFSNHFFFNRVAFLGRPFFGQLPFWQRRLAFWLWKESIGTILLVLKRTDWYGGYEVGRYEVLVGRYEVGRYEVPEEISSFSWRQCLLTICHCLAYVIKREMKGSGNFLIEKVEKLVRKGFFFVSSKGRGV
jgi:hypothetical protein